MNAPAQAPIGFLDLPRQQAAIADALRQRVDAVMRHCRFVMGPEVAELESRLASYVGASECVGVSSGTDAIQVVLMAEGIGEGDAVFLPAFTYTATAEVPLVLGATPVFVDVDPHTFQIDPENLRQRIADVRRAGRLRPRALIGVDLFGQPAPWPELRAIAAEEDLFLMADCAQAYGASLSGRRLGREGVATTLSFFPSKPLGAYGDAGAILTDDPERAELYRSLRTHGEGKTRYEVLRTGMNARLDTLQAAIILAKLDRFDAELARRRAIASAYDRGITGHLTPPARVADSESSWAIYSVLTRGEADRAAMQEKLKARGVASAIYYPRPLHRQPAYEGCHDGASLPVAEDISRRIMALPLHPELSDNDVARVIAAVCA
ncbi:aminotransferase DegT [Komagataeibacter nataicola]|uniref:Aminotransferase DegT n=1 Tax=Komagataeibacter nataicola TaxID=265960 RepID=A0A9N7CPG3_9PROT|nr:DegT/DnrJ/EryC1/StrS family aminotransferase [Komagataeibacter nataicola]AQU88309.1 aminotransferase DegT [Komagataeibacter nataicola]PYD67633.1 aminotransferase DegT [Komagataeibacter nataicola]WEQ54584.1 DegT/DnrJ/EryC1/StrS family aminotransferase [Komagataeibacter nataicola]WNM08961.1 DegT/DnrJ/EryC1/StrS family aminotransferase [Komagataeibacter nataicola]GBR13693.1 pleiotropic regulatory protein [Komagataeibacter nataicola NRIC 0616]